MPLRRTVGISLACLVTSACAMAEVPEESTSHDPREATCVPLGNAENSTDAASRFPCGSTQEGRSVDCSSERVKDIPDPPVRVVGSRQFGKAAWYDLVGKHTASGEILDTVAATAAHRSLPLASFAKVTNLDNGHWVVVKINDRGPYTRGRILDLSPRAADALDMKRAGVAAVFVEPVIQAARPVAVFQTSGLAVAQ